MNKEYKTTFAFSALALCLVLGACGKNAAQIGNARAGEQSGQITFAVTAPGVTENPNIENNEKTGDINGAGVPDALPEQVARTENGTGALYGKKTGTSKTFTGLEPLPQRKLTVNDPDNTRRLSENAVSHSYGVSKDGKPHEISVNNQKIYEKYGGLCLDTSGQKVIYLTFDCGYENGVTERILDTLKQKKVPAAFFVTLPYIESAPETVARMINEGHTVGNHSDTHPNFANITRTQMAKEIETVDNTLREKFGYSAPFFRFPEGAYSESALELVESLGFKSVFWSSAYADWDVNAQKGADYAFETVTKRLHPGCVLLLHAVSSDNADALGRIIDYARAEGYSFVSL